MSSDTYNPIGQVHNQLPVVEAGTKLVAMRNGSWVEASSVSDDALKVKALSHSIRGIFIALGLLFLLFAYIFGLVGGILFTGAIAIGFVAFINLQRTHPISLLFLGAPTQYYLVDVSPHTLRTEHSVQLGETIKKVKVILQFRANVQDAVGVVREGITDAHIMLEQQLFRALQGIAKSATLTDRLKGFKESLREFSDGSFTDNYFKISDMTFELSIDSKTTEWLEDEANEGFKREGRERELREAQHEAVVEAGKIRAKKDVYKAKEESRDLERQEIAKIFETAETLKKELLRPGANREAIHEELNSRLAGETQSFQKKIELLRFLIEQGALEVHEIQSKYPGFSENLLADVARGLEGNSSSAQLAAPDPNLDKPLIEQQEEPSVEKKQAEENT